MYLRYRRVVGGLLVVVPVVVSIAVGIVVVVVAGCRMC